MLFCLKPITNRDIEHYTCYIMFISRGVAAAMFPFAAEWGFPEVT